MVDFLQSMPKRREKSKRAIVTSPYFRTKNENDEMKIKQEEAVIKEEPKIKTLDEEPVQDNLLQDLKVMFIGINPGLASAEKRHHYAGPTNHFWPCLSESGLVDRKVTYVDDEMLPSLYQLGFTNLTSRATRSASDLTLSEQRDNIPVLKAKIERYRPKVACFIGKGIYEIYSRKKCNELGLQDESCAVPWANGEGRSLIFVMPSTSGIVTAYQKPDKLRYLHYHLSNEKLLINQWF